MKLGLSIGYSGATLRLPIDRIKLAEELGYDSVWTAEAYGSDAITVLAWIAAFTTRIRLGTGIMQLAGRAPAMAAMQTQTVDALAGGKRVIAGLGVSGPQIVEGWYGEPWGRPYWRLRDYIQIMRKVNRREEPVRHEGREISLPYTRRRVNRPWEAADVHPAYQCRATHLVGKRERVHGTTGRRVVRRLAPPQFRSRENVHVQAVDRRGVPPGRKR